MSKEILIILEHDAYFENHDNPILKFYKYDKNNFAMVRFNGVDEKVVEEYNSSQKLVNRVINLNFDEFRVVELPYEYAQFWKKLFKENGIEYPKPSKSFEFQNNPEKLSYQNYFGDLDEFKEII